MAPWGLCCLFLALWRLGGACPAFCSCSSARISCVGQERGGIVAFPVMQPASDMENITEIYIANQSNFQSINDMDLKFYRNLRNLTVTNTSLTHVSRLAFHNNAKLQYLNLKDNKLSTLSWKIFRHLNISYLILTGNRLRCSCENMWIRLWLGDEADSQELRCLEDSGGEKPLLQFSPPNCSKSPPIQTLLLIPSADPTICKGTMASLGQSVAITRGGGRISTP
ncbi:hypothetical protein Z043_100919 [Scleropages formosus]|uniref:Growth factor receptor NTRK leucine rich repeat C-terminal domain-containing protein n=1 Tax=Scleropages formosus TaxID=113540 RepID=A0A0P7VZI5_SCLFO|nr:hypothetical protein Z043_100919 [Scleropages formosus]